MRIRFKFIIVIIISTITFSLVISCLPSFADSISLTCNANVEASLADCKVYYKAGSATLPFNGTNATIAPIDVPKQTNITLSAFDSCHTDYFALTAFDPLSIENEYSKIAAIPEAIPPSVFLAFSGYNSNVSGPMSIILDDSDNIPVVKVRNGMINLKVVFPIFFGPSRNSVKSRNQIPEATGWLTVVNHCLEMLIALKT